MESQIPSEVSKCIPFENRQAAEWWRTSSAISTTSQRHSKDKYIWSTLKMRKENTFLIIKLKLGILKGNIRHKADSIVEPVQILNTEQNIQHVFVLVSMWCDPHSETAKGQSVAT